MDCERMESEIFQADPQRLAVLINGQVRGNWSHDDLRAMLQHQLATPLLLNINSSPSWSEQDRQLLATIRFGELLTLPTPSLELLRSTKNFAKGSDSREECPLPPELGTLLYYAAIVAAKVRLGQWITELAVDQVLAGVRWAISLVWVTPELMELFEAGEKLLERSSGQKSVGD